MAARPKGRPAGAFEPTHSVKQEQPATGGSRADSLAALADVVADVPLLAAPVEPVIDDNKDVCEYCFEKLSGDGPSERLACESRPSVCVDCNSMEIMTGVDDKLKGIVGEPGSGPWQIAAQRFHELRHEIPSGFDNELFCDAVEEELENLCGFSPTASENPGTAAVLVAQPSASDSVGGLAASSQSGAVAKQQSEKGPSAVPSAIPSGFQVGIPSR
jgi:hypothetical protein